MVLPSMTRAAAFASGDAGRLAGEGHGAAGPRVCLQHIEGRARQRELDVEQAAHADALAIASVLARTASMSRRPRVIGGSTHAESPEWMPASSMCSITPPR